MENKPIILVVDDERSNISIVSQILSNTYAIKAVNNGEKALKAISEHAIDLILLDIQMPGINGFEVAKTIRTKEQYSNMPIIFLTSQKERDSVIQGFDAGGNDYITKPFNPKELEVRVANHIRTAQLQSKLKKLNENLAEQVESEVAQKLALIDEKKEQEHLLHQQSKMAAMGEMVSAIAHQWKQPLNMLALLANSIEFSIEREERKELEQELINTQERILNQVDFMAHTIDDFRNFFNPSKEKESFLACEIIVSITEMFKGSFENNDITVLVHPHKHFSVYSNANEFKQVMLNILNNAKDVLLEREIENKIIECFIETHENVGTIKIRDNGGGIPQELLPDILFNAYVTTKGDKGTGIGLQISKRIIEGNMHGKLWVHNVDNGAEFVIELPIDNR